jgi:glycosyltransferase involved in cell wall biosynthesis
MQGIGGNSKPPRTILIGTLPPPTDGQSVAFQMLKDGFDERGYEYELIDIASKIEQRHYSVFSLRRLIEYGGKFGEFIRLFFPSGQVVYITIAQSWVGFLRDFVFTLLSILGRHRLIFHLHGGGYKNFYQQLGFWQQRIVRFALRRADTLIVLSHNLKSMFDFEPRIKSRIRVVYNGAPGKGGKVQTEPKKLPSDGSIEVLFLSNLIVEKGYFDLLEAARILVHREKQPFKFHFCGSFVLLSEGKQYATVEDAEDDFHMRVSQYDLAEHITWHGVVRGREKEKMLEGCHFFVLPTYYPTEGQPLSIIEAMSNGLVCIVTKHSSIPEIIGEAEGSFVEARKPEEIACALMRYKNSPENFELASVKALERFQRYFTCETHLDSLFSLLREC